MRRINLRTLGYLRDFLDQADSLSYFYAEEEKDLSVDSCERCGQGIRTLGTKHHGAPVLPILDELVISHLAIAAVKGEN